MGPTSQSSSDFGLPEAYFALGGALSLQDLPAEAQAYVKRVGELCSCPVEMISVGEEANARLIAQDKGMSDLVQVEVPKRIVLNAPVVTADNVEEYLPLGFES